MKEPNSSQPRPVACSLARFRSSLALAAALVAFTAPTQGADFNWDPLGDQSNSGGFGIWDLTELSWNDNDVAPNVVWPNQDDAVAIFGGVGGVVIIDTAELGTGVTVNKLVFKVDGYTVGSDEPSEILTLGGVAPGVQVDAGTATIANNIAGTSGLTKTGAGTLSLRPTTGGNTFLGTIAINAGTLDFDGDDRLGDVANDIVINGGRLDYNGFVDWNPDASRVITIGAAGATIGGSRVIRITDAEQIIGSGDLIREGTGTTFALDLQQPNVGFTGNTIINSGALEYRNDLALGNTPGQTVTVNGGLFTIATGPFTGNIAPTLVQPVTLNGGSIGFQNQIGGRYAGDVSVAADSGISVTDFYQAANRGGVIDGVLSGSSRLTVTGVTFGIGGTPATGSVLLRNPGNTFSGTISIGSGAHVRTIQGGGVDTLGTSTIELAGGGLGLAPVVTAAGANPGLFGRYYNSPKFNNGVAGGFDWGAEPMILSRNDATIDYASAPTGPGVGGTNMGVVWTGILQVTNPGTYVFSFRSDDGTLVYVDGQQVVANDFSQGANERFGSIHLPVGFHPIVMKYAQGAGGAAAQAYYNGPDTGNAKVLFGSVADSVTNLGAAKFGSMLMDNPINVVTTGDIDLTGADAISAGTLTFAPFASLRVTGVTGFETLTQAGPVSLNGANTISAGITLLGNQTNSHGSQSSGADLVIVGDITEAVPGSSLTKDGPRTVTLRGTNNFTGGITVNAGILSGTVASFPTNVLVNFGGTLEFDQATDGAFNLMIDGSGTVRKAGAGNLALTGANPFAGTVDVVGGTLSGTGSVQGTVAVQATGTLGGTSIGTFSMAGLSFAPKSRASFALGAPTLVPQFDVLGTVAASIAELSFTGSGDVAAGTYRLIDYAGAALTPQQFAGFSVGTPPAGFFVGLVNNTVDTAVDVIVEAPAATRTWTGAQSGTWDAAVAENWIADAYADGLQVVFDGTGANRVISGPAVAPQSITVHGEAGTDYLIANAIGGTLAGGLRKLGANTLHLTGANTFTGSIVVSGGTLSADVTSTTNSLGSANVQLAAGSVLQLNPSFSTLVNGLSSRYFSTAPSAATTGPTNLQQFDFTQTAAVLQVDTNFDPAAYTETNLPAGGAVGFDESATNTSWRNFAIERVGKIRIDRAGLYSFNTVSDDGTRIFIDRRLVATANGGHGNVEGSGVVFLTPGFHDFRYEFAQGSGGADERIMYSGPGIAKQVIPSSVMFAADSSSLLGSTNTIAMGTPVTALGSARFDLQGTEFTGVELGILVTNGGTITVSGPTKLLAAKTTLLSNSVTFDHTADLSLGKVDDLGSPVTITKTGTGRLFLENSASGSEASVLSAGTVLAIQDGDVYARGNSVAGSTNPLGAAAVMLDGGNIILDSIVNGVTFANAFTTVKSGTIDARTEGQTVVLSGALTIAAGTTLTLDVAGGTRGSNANTTIPGQAVAGATLNLTGGITGEGDLTLQSTQFTTAQAPVSGSVFLRQPATHTGLTRVVGNYGSSIILDIRGQGRLLNTSGINAPGEIQLHSVRLNLHNNDGGNVNDRIPDAMPISMRNGTLRFDGANAAAANETIGPITLLGSQNNLFGGTAGGTVFQTLTVGAITRQDRATLRLDANNMGSLTSANGVRFVFTDATGFTDDLVGGDGLTGTNGKIVPWAWGAPTGNNRSLVTYDVNGLRFLGDGEYAAELDASTDPTDNVRQTYASATTVGSGTPQTVNSLVFVNTATSDQTLTLLGGSTLNVTSGAVMLSTTDGTARRVILEGGNLNFGTAEGIIISSRREHLMRSLLSGSNGITLTGDGSITLDNASNNFTGDIHVNLGGSPLSGSVGLFIQNEGSLGAAGNDLFIDGSSFRFNTAFTLNANRTVNIGPGGALIDTNNQATGIAGQITGPGSLRKSNNNTLTLSNAANDYTGDTYIHSGNLVTNTGPQGDIHHYATDNNGFAGTNRVLTFNQTFDGTYGGDIDGVGDVVKAGTGRVTFTGDHTYTGITTVNAGALIVNGTISGSTVLVNNGRLEGNGDIFHNLSVGNSNGIADAILAPGDGIGTFTVGGSTTFSIDAAFELQINSTTLVTDRLVSGGAVNLGSQLVPLTIFDLAPAPLSNGEAFVFIQAEGGVFGEFAGLSDGSTVLVGGNEFFIDYGVNTVALLVPEPGAMACLLGGLGVLLGFRRSRRHP